MRKDYIMGNIADSLNNYWNGASKPVADSITPYREAGGAASRAYSTGQYLYFGSALYRVTAAIAAGGAITPGTNCTATTVAEALAAAAAGPDASTDSGLAAFSGTGGKTLKKAGSKGSSTQGIYLDANGVPQPMSYSVNKTVPSDAKFTDTTYSAATQSAAGLLSADDKKKLDGVASGATANSPYTSAPSMDGTASAGSSADYARGDHVHPADTSRAPKNHRATATTYGAGTGTYYGHVKLSDATDSTSGASGGIAATPAAVYNAVAPFRSQDGFFAMLDTVLPVGEHRNVYRGKYLGTGVTSEQWSAIGAGTFKGLYIGDYWTIGGVNWRIADFDYWLNYGDTACTTHHAVIVPDTCLYNARMYATNSTAGGYVGSEMRTDNLESAKTTIRNAFGSAHILSKRLSLVNSFSDGIPGGTSWYDTTVELMDEINVYGCQIFAPGSNGNTPPSIFPVDHSQMALFRLNRNMICNRANWWLRDIAAGARFAVVLESGQGYYNWASNTVNGVRPAFAICA